MTTPKTKKTAVKKPTAAEFSAPIAEVHLVPIELIDCQTQIRTNFDHDSIVELSNDILERGLMQPVLLNPDGNGRFVMIAGERRLRAVKLNGQTAIPALITKADKDSAVLMQLAENVQREDLNLTDECAAIEKLYAALGSMKAVSDKVKKSVSWCSKRSGLCEKLHWLAKRVFTEGVSEDIEVLKGLSDAFYLDWNKGNELEAKVRKGEAGRKEVREAVKALKAEKVKKINARKTGEVSHAKVKKASPPPTPVWDLESAIGDIEEALQDPDAEKTGIETLWSFSQEQQQEIIARLNNCAAAGADKDGLQAIRNPVFNSYYETKISSLETMAMIAGYGGKTFDAVALIDLMQKKKNSD